MHNSSLTDGIIKCTKKQLHELNIRLVQVLSQIGLISQIADYVEIVGAVCKIYFAPLNLHVIIGRRYSE